MPTVNGIPAMVTVAAPMGVAGSSNVAGARANVSVAAPVGLVFGDQEYYTENLCPNPSFETDLSGYVALTGTTLSQETTQGFSGRSSMKVVTDGSRSSEGFTAAQAFVPETGSGSMSFYIMGQTGTITVSAISGATATVIAQTSVTLSGGDYHRVALSGLSLNAGQQMYLLVQTNTAQAITFWVDAFQYEMNAAPNPYIDGSFPGCHWEGTAHESASYQQYQFMISAKGGMFLEGRATPVVEGEVFTIKASGGMLLSGTEHGTLVINPTGALSNFGIWTAADMDPETSYPEWSNAGASSGAAGSWTRVYALAYPPTQQLASDGTVRQRRAAYAALGFTFKAMANNGQQVLSDVQFERMPISPGNNPVPTAYQQPRTISTIVKPSRLNFCPNPSLESSAAWWGGIGTGAVARDATVSNDGGHSLKVTVNAANDGATITLANLIVGDLYIVSAYVKGGAGLEDVLMSTSSGGSVSSSQQGVPYGGNAILGIGYGQGPYGGIQAAGADMPTTTWFRPSLIFTALQSSVQLGFRALVGSDVAYPANFWIDDVLVEEGELLGSYFDGSTGGNDYTWEAGGTPGETRSYYYQRQNVASGAVTTALAEHTPLGIAATTPIYSSAYSQ